MFSIVSNGILGYTPEMRKAMDIIDQKFGRLIVIERDKTTPTKNRDSMWSCACDCGNTTTCRGRDLKKGATTSCGCFRKEFARDKATTHGESNTAEFKAWTNMRQRCFSKQNASFNGYGGRGITVCDRWSSYINFINDMGDKPTRRHSIERADNDGHYTPCNCYWALPIDQMNNTRFNRKVTHKGETLSVRQWERRLHVGRGTITSRLNRGWSVERALAE